MNIDQYLAALDAKLHDMTGLITSWSIKRDVDIALGIGFIKGYITFVDNSRLEFSEQLPITRHKFRLHYMDERDNLVMRWDSAPHHRDLSTFPFHRHTPLGVEEHKAITLLEALGEIAKVLMK